MQIQNIGKSSVDLTGLLTATNTNSKTSNSLNSISFDKVLLRSGDSRNVAEQVVPISDSRKKVESSVNATKEYHATKKELPKKTSGNDNKTADPKATAKEPVTNETNNKAESTSKSESNSIAENTSKSESISKSVEEIKETIMETLSISEEELTELMSILNLSMIDLLNPDHLKELVLASAGAEDVTALLTEEGLNQSLNQLLQVLDQTLAQQGLTLEDVEILKKSENEFMSMLEGQTEMTPSTEENLTVMGQTKEISQVVDENNEDSAVKFNFEAIKQTQEGSKEESTSNQSDSQTQGKELTPAEQFLNQLTQTVTTRTEFSNELQNVQEIRTITNQIVEEIKVVIKPSQTSMDMMLNPEHLGKVALNISSKDGVLTASFITQTQVAKEAIESQIQVLKENLEAQGLKVEAIEVTVSNFGFDHSGQMEGQNNKNEQGKAKSSRPLRLDGLDELGTEEEIDNASDAWSDSSFDTSA